MRSTTAQKIAGLIFGAGFGFVLAAAKLHEYSVIHAMLRLEEAYTFLLMAGAIGVSMPLLWLLDRAKVTTLLGGQLALSRSKVTKANLVGGALFGLGWAVSGTCPGPAVVMLSSGAGLAVLTVLGLFLGLTLRDRQVARAGGTATVGDGEQRQVVAS